MNTNGHRVRVGPSSGRGLLLSLYGFVYECPGLVAGFGGYAWSEEQFPAESGVGYEGGGEAVKHGGAFWPGGKIDRRAINRRG